MSVNNLHLSIVVGVIAVVVVATIGLKRTYDSGKIYKKMVADLKQKKEEK